MPTWFALNPREQALLVWIAIFVIGALSAKSTRSSAIGVIRAFFAPKVVGVYLAAAIYVACCVWILRALDAWTARNLKTVVFWFLGSVSAILLDIEALGMGTKTLRKIVRDALAVSAVILFLSSLETFSFLAELLLLPFLAILALASVVAERDEKMAAVAKLLVVMRSIAGISILGYSLYRAVLGWRGFEPLHQAREFGLPIALTVIFIPFLYGLMLLMAQESASIGLQFRIADPSLRRYARIRGTLAFGLNLDLFQRYVQSLRQNETEGRTDVVRTIGEVRRARRRELLRPIVDWRDGWSPDDAVEFLTDQELRTDPYHRSMTEWGAQSRMLEIGEGLFPDRLTYRIAGTETSATQLTLVVDVNDIEAADVADARFQAVALLLVTRALGDETARRLERIVQTGRAASLVAGAIQLDLTRDDWSGGKRSGYTCTLRIRHPAHRKTDWD